jgi:hypothetical protein
MAQLGLLLLGQKFRGTFLINKISSLHWQLSPGPINAMARLDAVSLLPPRDQQASPPQGAASRILPRQEMAGTSALRNLIECD